MKKIILESKTRNALYKTENGVEVRPMLHSKFPGDNYSQNDTYYYVYYSYNKEDRKWKIFTNHLLYGEGKTLAVYHDKEEAEKTARIVNDAIHLLIENI